MAQPVHEGIAVDLPDDPELRRQEQRMRWREKRQVWFDVPRFALCAFHYFSQDKSRGKLDRARSHPRNAFFRRWLTALVVSSCRDQKSIRALERAHARRARPLRSSSRSGRGALPGRPRRLQRPAAALAVCTFI